jgi:tetrahydromethanopterin S-methyltransferase subunit C
MTRDSIVWWIGIATAVVMGIGTVGDVASYGIPEKAVPYIRLAALVLGIVSGKLATSPLKGKGEL